MMFLHLLPGYRALVKENEQLRDKIKELELKLISKQSDIDKCNQHYKQIIHRLERKLKKYST